MKKGLLFSLVICCYLLNSNLSFSEDNIIVPEMINERKIENVLSISDKYIISEQDGKYAIIDINTGKNKLGLWAENIELFDTESPNDYKIKFKNESTDTILTGYFNPLTEQTLITNYNEIYLLGDYLKVKEDTKYGLINKDGKTILMPIFDRINIFTQNDKEYISAKINGKSKIYSTDGNLIPEEDLYTISYDGVYAIAADLKPEFKKYVIKTRKSNYLFNIGYQVEEVEAPKDVQVASVVENIVETELKEKTVDDINKLTEDIQEEVNTKTILVGKKYFIIKEKNDLLGLYTEKDKEILPIEYNRLSITNLKNPIILADKENELYAFNLSGKLIGKKSNNEVETYRFGKTYQYIQNENGWNLESSGKQIGKLEFDGVEYKFIKTKFNPFSYNRLNDIFIALNKN